jgi:hypothetical protein
MTKPVEKKLSERERRQARLAQQLRSNLLKRKVQTRARSLAQPDAEVRPAGNTAGKP